MTSGQDSLAGDPEIEAISRVYACLRELPSDAQQRVLSYVSSKLGVAGGRDSPTPERQQISESHPPAAGGTSSGAAPEVEDNADGISPVALKWMRRSGLTVNGLSTVFSIGLDDIDLVAKSVPGANKKERMKSVILLKGIAAYLASGASRIAHEQAKEACLHYDAFDNSNFAAYLRSFAADVGGTKESGYSLTAKGMTAATELLKAMISPSAK